MRILIIKLGAMGDVLRTTSILPALKDHYPGCGIDWITKDESMDLLRNNQHLDTVFPPKRSETGYDLVLSLDDDEEACRIASQTKTKKLFGAYDNNGVRTYTEDSSPWFDMGLISRFGKEKADQLKKDNTKTYQEILFGMLGLGDHKKYPPQLILPGFAKTFAQEFAKRHQLDNSTPVLGINTGAGGRWQDKRLSIEQTVELIRLLGESTLAKLILFGGPEEKERNQDILERSPVQVIDAKTDNSLLEFAALVDLCDAVITSDSLALHIATALGKKVVAFFYPTPEAEIELYGKGERLKGKGASYCSYQAVCDHPPEWDIAAIAEAVQRQIP